MTLATHIEGKVKSSQISFNKWQTRKIRGGGLS